MASALAASAPPLVPGLPLIGSALDLGGDISAFILRCYQQYGNVFRIRILNRDVVVLAGLEANRLLAKDGNELFTGERFFGGFAEQFETQNFLPAMEGPTHRHLRKVLRPGYSKEAVAPHLAQLLAITEDHVGQWAARGTMPVVDVMQRLITDQLGIVLGGRALGEYFPYFRRFLRTIVSVSIIGTAPRAMLYTPAYRQARAKTREFLVQLIAERQASPAGNGDLIDVAMAARDLQGNTFSDDDLVVFGLGAYVAGMDTLANTLSFMIYALLKNPDVLAQVRAEADALFANGAPALNALRSMKALHGAAVETLRLYMIAPITSRTALVDFEFGGYRIAAGQDVMVANGITHFLPEYYPDPHKFDITRDFSSVPANVFAPFTLGSHTCLGAGMAEGLLMFTAAALVHHADMALAQLGYTARVSATPAPNPGAGFRITVRRRAASHA